MKLCLSLNQLIQFVGTEKSGWYGPHPNQYGEGKGTGSDAKRLRSLTVPQVAHRLERARIEGIQRALHKAGYKTQLDTRGRLLIRRAGFLGLSREKVAGKAQLRPVTKVAVEKSAKQSVAAELNKLVAAGNPTALAITKAAR